MPEVVWRHVKARAALEGETAQDYAARVLRAAAMEEVGTEASIAAERAESEHA